MLCISSHCVSEDKLCTYVVLAVVYSWLQSNRGFVPRTGHKHMPAVGGGV